jgi:serine/threonine protein kinase
MLAESGELSKKIDVYAFGAVLMEIITGRKILDDSLHDRHLTPIFRRRVQDKENLRNIVDPTLELNGEGWNTLQKIAEVAYCCTNEEPKLRPEIHDCVSFIDKLLSKLMGKWKPIINSEAAETSSKEKMPLEEMIRNIYTSSSSSG